MLMELYTAHLEGTFDEWYDSHSADYVENCMELSRFAVEYSGNAAR